MTYIYRLVNKLREFFFRHVLTPKTEKILKKTGIYCLLKYIFSGFEKIIFAFESFRDETEKTFKVEEIQATFKVSSGKERQLFYGNQLDSANLPALTKLLDNLCETDVFWDVGAHIGIYSCFIGQVLEPNNLVCFEPHPENVKRLKQNLKLNKINDAKMIEAGLSNKNNTIYFEANNNQAGAVGKVTENETSLSVPIYRGDTILQKEKLRVPKAIKMDISGEEWNAVEGLNRIFSSDKCQLFICEFHPLGIREKGGSTQKLIKRIQDFGFQVEELQRSSYSKAKHFCFYK